MIHWLIPANNKVYNVLGAFSASETYWPVNAKISMGDIVYIYLAAPYKQIAFVCHVIEVGLDQESIIESIQPFFKNKGDNKKTPKQFMKLQTISPIALDIESPLAYQYLKLNGLKGMLMGARKLENNPALLDYITRSCHEL